jgi:ABC-2 type transport system ATP-binding protein
MNDVFNKTNQLLKRYGSVPEVKGLNLEVRSGEIFGFPPPLGPNAQEKQQPIKC